MSVHIPDSYKQVYEFELEKKTFQQYRQTFAERQLLPELIRLETNNGYNSITGANTLLRIRNNTNWNRCNISGLRPTGDDGFYYADFIIETKKSLAVVKVSSGKVETRVCPQYYPHHKPQLMQLVKHIIQHF